MVPDTSHGEAGAPSLDLLECLFVYSSNYFRLRNFAEATRRGYLSDQLLFVRYLKAEHGVSRITEVERTHIIEYLSQAERRGLRGTTRARKRAALRSFFNYLEEAGRIQVSPVRGIPRPKQEVNRVRYRAESVRRLAKRLRLALEQSGELATKIEEHARSGFLPLTQLCGVSLITAGALAGILGPGLRFASDAQLAAYAGVAPLEASSAEVVRHRLNRGGNRRLNAVVYRIALTQAHHHPEARAYLARRVSEGKTRREARRALARFIVRAIWRVWQECQPVCSGLAAMEAA